jgi:Fe-Mn family superoxide dismutase
MSFKLKPLPYKQVALEPHISARTVSYHYDKHHAGYVDKLNKATENTPLIDQPLESIILSKPDQAIYNSAAQVWNHDLYWQSLSPDGTRPGKELDTLIERSFGDRSKLEQRLKDAALGQFGSGWAWLLLNKETDKLEICSTTDAVCPLNAQHFPLLTVDVWEHAYYLDYQNDRGSYLEAVIAGLLNWETATERLELALETA